MTVAILPHLNWHALGSCDCAAPTPVYCWVNTLVRPTDMFFLTVCLHCIFYVVDYCKTRTMPLLRLLNDFFLWEGVFPFWLAHVPLLGTWASSVFPFFLKCYIFDIQEHINCIYYFATLCSSSLTQMVHKLASLASSKGVLVLAKAYYQHLFSNHLFYLVSACVHT